MSIIAIVLARSEGALAGILAAFIIGGVIWFSRRLRGGARKFVWAGLGLGFATIILFPVIILNIFPKHYYPNFNSSILNYTVSKMALKDLSGEIRKQQWRETWEMMKEDGRWLFGTGLINYPESVKPYHQEGIFYNFEGDPDFRRKIVHFDAKYKAEHWQPVEIYLYPHNIVLNFWTELGLTGVVLFMWLIVNFFVVGTKIMNKKDIGYWILDISLLGAMVVVIVHGLVDVPYFKNDLAVIFWVLFALMGLLRLSHDSLARGKK